MYLRSLNHEPALICLDALPGTTASLKITGPVKARQTLRTLLWLIFPHLKADRAALKACTHSPLFRYWFQVEAMVEEQTDRECPTQSALVDLKPVRNLEVGHLLLWQGLFHPEPLDQVRELQKLTGHLCSRDESLAKELLLAGLVPYQALERAIQQTSDDHALTDQLLSQGWLQPETVQGPSKLDSESRNYFSVSRQRDSRQPRPRSGDRAMSPMVAIGDRSPENLRPVQRSR
ncbi:hypothetical protein VZG28_10145 [Synechococcus elongatus IITB4]|uniref:hypothetical protein n=1 Tax=Synechococcus elongatus TaxID=32046 RepID=UPI0030CD4BE2